MALFQSFWSKPALSKRWKIPNQLESNLWITALSCAYARKNNIPLTMHTDDYGKELLKHLPYDSIKLTLNQLPSDTPIGQWAISKFYAQQEHPLGDIHIDNDVFIKKRSLYDLMTKSHYDCIVQSFELADFGGYVDAQELVRNIEGIPTRVDLRYAYNVGIIGFQDKELKQKYIDDYFKFYEIVRKDPKVEELISTNDFTCELLIEQQHLWELCNHKIVKCVLPNRSFANELGYTHLLGGGKYARIEQVKETLKKLDPEIYNKTLEMIEAYGNTIRQS